VQQNLEQIRATNALRTAAQAEGNVRATKGYVSKLPAMILTNGLLAALAFASERKAETGRKRPEMNIAATGIAQHLADPRLQVPGLSHCRDADSLLAALAKLQSLDLQRATDEALAFLGYLKRFAPSGKEDGEES
jgi:CRISPR type III-B/RAMP module-associated protein Cmr5